MSKYHFSIQEQGIIKQPLCPISNHLCKQKANYNTNRNTHTHRWNQAHIKIGFKLINDNKSTEASKTINLSPKTHTQKQKQEQ
jgi:hypothetical protein